MQHIKNRLKNRPVAAVSCRSFAFAQSITGLPPTEPGSIQSSLTAVRPDVVVFTGDRVISQFVGGSWVASITVTNLETHSTSFNVLFFPK
jgi:hypothetical protein